MTEHVASCTRVRRSDAGLIRLTSRDTTGLCLTAEQYAAPYDQRLHLHGEVIRRVGQNQRFVSIQGGRGGR